MTIKQLSFLKIKKTAIKPLDFELILAYTLKKSRVFILAHPEKIISSKQLVMINKNIKKRARGEPLAYILGSKEFYGLNFKVNKNVLVPRPETELMVEETLKLITHNPQPATLIDVGTGSGCIIITLANLLKSCELQITRYKFIAVDISTKALAVAKQNAKSHKVEKKIKFVKSDLLSSILNSKFKIHNSSLIILANLPYLTPGQIKNSPSIKFEPKLALSAGSDGLKYYRLLLKQINILRLSAPNQRLSAIFEIDPSQKNKIISLIKKELPAAKAQIKKDLRSHSRIAVIELKNA